LPSYLSPTAFPLHFKVALYGFLTVQLIHNHVLTKRFHLADLMHTDQIQQEQIDIDIRPWSAGDLPLLEQLMGNPAMTEHLGGPETPQKIRLRHERYCRSSDSGVNPMFVIIAGPERLAVGSIGYWERQWRGQSVWETGWSVLPWFQGRGVATRAATLLVERARSEGKHRFIHAFPSVDNGPSNAICRKVGFTLQEEVNFEYPPGHFMRCNDWRLDLLTGVTIA
jgi:RimJ/RimL family protein N-acetyltransferase